MRRAYSCSAICALGRSRSDATWACLCENIGRVDPGWCDGCKGAVRVLHSASLVFLKPTWLGQNAPERDDRHHYESGMLVACFCPSFLSICYVRFSIGFLDCL